MIYFLFKLDQNRFVDVVVVVFKSPVEWPLTSKKKKKKTKVKGCGAMPVWAMHVLNLRVVFMGKFHVHALFWALLKARE